MPGTPSMRAKAEGGGATPTEPGSGPLEAHGQARATAHRPRQRLLMPSIAVNNRDRDEVSGMLQGTPNTP